MAAKVHNFSSTNQLKAVMCNVSRINKKMIKCNDAQLFGANQPQLESTFSIKYVIKKPIVCKHNPKASGEKPLY